MTLHVETQGSGPDLVLLHGWGMHAGIWDEFAQALASRHRVHVVDLPGYGASAACLPYTLGQIASEVASVVPPRCLVCGWSLGGQVALVWAKAAPQQVTRLALIATTPCFTRRADWPHAVEPGTLREFAQALATEYAGTLRRFLSLQTLGDERARQIAARLRARLFERGRPDVRILEAGLQILLTADLRSELAAIPQPALVLHGERDRLVPPAAGEYLSRTLPAARLATVRGAAHAPFVADMESTHALLTGFLDEQ